jgi:PAS domain S-box-containing protein
LYFGDVFTLMMNNKLLSNVLLAINDCAWAYDLNKKEYLFINDRIEPILGVTANELKNDNELWHKLIIADDAASVIELTNNLKKDNWLELTYRIKAGKWIFERKTIFTDGDTDILLGVVKDVTDQKSVKYHLNEALGNFGILFDHNPNPMWIYELPSLRILKVNEAAINLYGYSADEFLTLTIRDIRPKIDLARFNQYIFRKQITKGTLHGYNHSGIWRHENKNGDTIYAEITGHEIKYNNTSCRIVVATDVTERVLFEQEMKNLKAQ